MCQISGSTFDVRFPTCQFYLSKCDITRPPNFRKFLQTAEECCDRNIFGTFWKLGSLVKSNFDRWTIPFLYKCQISDSLFDVRFPTCQFYLLKCEVTRAPDFQKVLQTSEEFCNKNIPVVFTASTSNGGLKGGFDFFDLRVLLLTRLTLWLLSEKFLTSLTYTAEKFDFPEFHVLNLTFLTFQARILTYSKIYIL